MPESLCSSLTFFLVREQFFIGVLFGAAINLGL